MSSSYKVGDTEVFYSGPPDSPFPSRTRLPIIFSEIQKKFNKETPYVDVDFPATQESIGSVTGDQSARSGQAIGTYYWLRPWQIVYSAELDKEKFAIGQPGELFSENDIRQGGLGDCWYLAAVGDLTQRKDFLQFVIPDENYSGFDDDKYCGAFHFRFYSMDDGKWVDIVIDDQIPCKLVGYHYEPAFANIRPNHFVKTTEFWPALIEKAFAKFFGAYYKIEYGFVSQALENFTGGFSEIIPFNITDTSRYLQLYYWQHMSKYEFLKRLIKKRIGDKVFLGLLTFNIRNAYVNNALSAYTDYVSQIGWDRKFRNHKFGYKFDPHTQQGQIDSSTTGKGLNLAHAYSILDAKEVKQKVTGVTLFLLKLSNPHGAHEWMGDYGDTDDKGWSLLEEDFRVKDASGKVDHDEGVFWIELKDIIQYFQCLEACIIEHMAGICFTQVKGQWPADLQYLNLIPAISNLHNYNAYKFEAKSAITTESADRCFFGITLVLNKFHCALKPNPSFTYFLYKVGEEDYGSQLTEIYTRRDVNISLISNIGREISHWEFIPPGTYIIVPALITAWQLMVNYMAPSIPPEFMGKSIDYTIRLFTENETTIEPLQSILPQRDSD